MKNAVSLIALAALLPACTMEPHYARPAPAVPQGWPAGSPVLQQDEASLPVVRYVDVFRDPALQRIIAQALANNQDLKAAMANVAIARGQYRVQRANIFPQIDVSAGATTRDVGGAGSGTSARNAGTQTNYTAQVGDTSFVLDLFGRLRSLSAAALDSYFATEAGVRSARLALVSDVASAYLALATDRSLLAIAADTVDNAGQSLRITRARLNGGVAPRTDVRQAETVLAQAEADRQNLIAQVVQDRNALELLVGAPVSDADLPVSIEAVDTQIAAVPAGLDSRILLRRPDVLQAEYALRASNAQIGAARAAFFPTISLTAVAGFASTSLSSLFNSGNFTWSAGPSASLPIFDAGARRGDLEAARGRFNLALAQYQRTIQTAFREVADALARRSTIDAEFAAQERLEAAARDTLTLSEARYRQGIDPFLDTLVAQRTLYSARRSLVAARLSRATSLVDLYTSLGGDELSDITPRSAGTSGGARAAGAP
ncbi:efflux transporter outer membrane subunit [Sphingomonas quercus]|uniref:Efflux transporter outer membrane subunit n=1 Tax=Sphingomonas quercus TaxID=2842451 RepID=A0ABS6BNG6_9SPHN|nr:efflux transporter outer membrane subunit [Sphingomonas quercus]MBU3078730.1 efflux transporter outer membrane subunit [Sphingomonas quercus]